MHINVESGLYVFSSAFGFMVRDMIFCDVLAEALLNLLDSLDRDMELNHRDISWRRSSASRDRFA